MNRHAFRFFRLVVIIIATWSGVASADAPRVCLYNPMTQPNLAPDNPAYEVIGNVAAGDATQKGRLVPGAASTCDAPKAAPAARDASVDVNYDAYTFENRSSAPSCISVTVYRDGPAGTAGTPLQVATYLGSFDAADIRSNYLADAGADDAAVYNFSFSVPGRTSFVVVLSATAKAAASVGYRLAVTNCSPLWLDTVTPRSAPATGGSTITIDGVGFTGAGPLDVIFESAARNVDAYATNVVVVDDTKLTATVPSAPAGIYKVIARSKDPPYYVTPQSLRFDLTCPASPDPSAPCEPTGYASGGGSVDAPLACTNAFDPYDDAYEVASGFRYDPIHGELLTGALTQKGLFVSRESYPSGARPPVTTCEVQQPPSPVVDATTDFPYNAYVFKNQATAAACISTLVISTPNPGGANGEPLYVAAYLGSFDPDDIQANYLASYNGVTSRLNFKVPAESDFVVVLSSRPATPPYREPTLPPMDRGYLLYVGGCDGSGPNVLDLTPRPSSAGDAGASASSGGDGAASISVTATEGDASSPSSATSGAPPKASADDATVADAETGASCNTSPHDAKFGLATIVLVAAAAVASMVRRSKTAASTSEED